MLMILIPEKIPRKMSEAQNPGMAVPTPELLSLFVLRTCGIFERICGD